jgi:hypothetical protein
MKKAYLYFFALTVLLASCKNEDELSPSKAILGIYQQEDVEFSIGLRDE